MAHMAEYYYKAHSRNWATNEPEAVVHKPGTQKPEAGQPEWHSLSQKEQKRVIQVFTFFCFWKKKYISIITSESKPLEFWHTLNPVIGLDI